MKRAGTGLTFTFSCGRTIEMVAAVEDMYNIDIIGHKFKDL